MILLESPHLHQLHLGHEAPEEKEKSRIQKQSDDKNGTDKDEWEQTNDKD